MTEYTIEQVSKLTGLSASRLRLWGMRYGWPNPKRNAQGYRMFSPLHVDQLKRLADLLAKGGLVSDYVRDGSITLPGDPKPQSELEQRLAELHQQVALLREVVLMPPHKRFSAEGQRLADIALSRTKSAQELRRRALAESQGRHDLIKTGDADAPESIKDQNGEVVLGLCRACGRAEVELSEPCSNRESKVIPQETIDSASTTERVPA